MDAWSLYWRADRLHSCIALDQAAQRDIDAYWVDFGRQLPPGSRLIDLATGNGAVVHALGAAGLDLGLCGVDSADIDPQKHLHSPDALRQVRFIGGVDLCEPAAIEARFDAATSQFGLEYLPPERRAAPLQTLLNERAPFQLLMHHADSEIVRPRRRDLRELTAIAQPEGVLPALLAFADGADNAASLEARGLAYLRTRGVKTQRLSGDVLGAIDQVLGAHEAGSAACCQMAADIYQRVMAETTRLEQLIHAALDAAALTQFTRQLTACGLQVDAAQPRHLRGPNGPILIGWHIAGRKR